MNIFIYLLFILFPILSLPLLIYLNIKERFRNNIPIFCMALALGLLSYAYVPDESKDIYRHYLLVKDFEIYGTEYLIYLFHFIGGPALFYLIAYLSGILDVYNLMPLLMVTSTYIFYLLGIKKSFVNFQIYKKFAIIISILWVFSSLSYPFISTNLRQPLAVALVFYCIQNQGMGKILIPVALLFASLLHVTGALMATCLLIAYFWKNKTYGGLVVSCIALFVGIMICYFLNFNFFNFLGYNFGVEDKFSLYENAKDISEYQFENFWKYILLSYINACVFLLICLQVMIKHWKAVKESIAIRFSVVFFGVTFCFIDNPIVFQRLMFYVPLFGLPSLSVFLFKENKMNSLYIITISLLFLSIAYAIVLQSANFRGYVYWHGVFYRDVFSILFYGQNYFLNY